MDQREHYRQIGTRLKSSESEAERFADSFEIRDAVGIVIGSLLPLNQAHSTDEQLVSDFARWRSEHSYAFLSQFPVTTESTASWIQNAVLDSPDRLVFLVLDTSGKRVGRVAVLDTRQETFELEVDNVLRGEPGAPGLIGFAIQTIERWVQSEFALSQISLEVIESNSRAVNLYFKLGYQESHRESMKWQVDGDFKVLRPGEPADEVVLTMSKNLS